MGSEIRFVDDNRESLLARQQQGGDWEEENGVHIFFAEEMTPECLPTTLTDLAVDNLTHERFILSRDSRADSASLATVVAAVGACIQRKLEGVCIPDAPALPEITFLSGVIGPDGDQRFGGRTLDVIARHGSVEEVMALYSRIEAVITRMMHEYGIDEDFPPANEVDEPTAHAILMKLAGVLQEEQEE